MLYIKQNNATSYDISIKTDVHIMHLKNVVYNHKENVIFYPSFYGLMYRMTEELDTEIINKIKSLINKEDDTKIKETVDTMIEDSNDFINTELEGENDEFSE